MRLLGASNGANRGRQWTLILGMIVKDFLQFLLACAQRISSQKMMD